MLCSCSINYPCQVWELSKCKLRTNHYGHTGYINAVSVSPDGSLAASGGKDGITMLWDLNDGKHLYSLEAGDVVNALVFSPNRYWLCAATASCVKIFDLESKYVLSPLPFLISLDTNSFCSSQGQSSMSSSRTLLMLGRTPANQNASHSPGLPMGRPSSEAFRMTLCGFGP